jgi:hypothetical protein
MIKIISERILAKVFKSKKNLPLLLRLSWVIIGEYFEFMHSWLFLELDGK